jgi:hypothetical protein
MLMFHHPFNYSCIFSCSITVCLLREKTKLIKNKAKKEKRKKKKEKRKKKKEKESLLLKLGALLFTLFNY